MIALINNLIELLDNKTDPLLIAMLEIKRNELQHKDGVGTAVEHIPEFTRYDLQKIKSSITAMAKEHDLQKQLLPTEYNRKEKINKILDNARGCNIEIPLQINSKKGCVNAIVKKTKYGSIYYDYDTENEVCISCYKRTDMLHELQSGLEERAHNIVYNKLMEQTELIQCKIMLSKINRKLKQLTK